MFCQQYIPFPIVSQRTIRIFQVKIPLFIFRYLVRIAFDAAVDRIRETLVDKKTVVFSVDMENDRKGFAPSLAAHEFLHSGRLRKVFRP